MNSPSLLVFLLAAVCSPVPLSATDWPVWRGPSGMGIAAADAAPPLTWSDGAQIRWKTPLPGRGHSTPIVFGNTIVLTTADEAQEIQSVLAFRRDTGEPIWKTDVHRGAFPSRIHRKNTHASPTAAFDGERIFVLFFQGGNVQLSALSPSDGSILWTKNTGPFRGQFNFGYGASPLIHDDLVIVSSDFPRGGYLAAFRRTDGDEVWRVPRSEATSYSSPIVARTGGRDQLVLSGAGQVNAYDPSNGRLLWSAEAGTKATCGTLIWDDERVYASGGYPGKQTVAVRSDGSTQVVWSHRVKCYEQSMLIHDGHIYAVADGGIAYCWDAESGRQKWVERLGGGDISASPVLVGDRIYATFERGLTVVFRANPSRFEKLGQSQLGDETFATPLFLGDRVYLRIAENSGRDRREYLVCVGK